MSKGKKNKGFQNKNKHIPAKAEQLKPKKTSFIKNGKNFNPNALKKTVIVAKSLHTRTSHIIKKVPAVQETQKPVQKKSLVNNSRNVIASKIVSQNDSEDDESSDAEYVKVARVLETDDDSDKDDIDLDESEDDSELETDDSSMENVVDSNDSNNISEDSGSGSDDEEYLKGVKKIETNKNLKIINKDQAKEVNKPEVLKKLIKADVVEDAKKSVINMIKKAPKEVKEVKQPQAIKTENETIKVQKFIDPFTESGKILTSINERKNFLSDCTVFVTNINKNIQPEEITKHLENVVNIDLPSSAKSHQKQRGYGFIRFANASDALKAIPILNGITLRDKQLIATKFVNRRLADDINRVDFSRLLLTSFTFKDITNSIRDFFPNGVTVKKINIVTYELKFARKGDAITVFNKERITIDGQRLLANFTYSIAETFDNSVIPVATKKVETESGEQVAKKAKLELTQEAKGEKNFKEKGFDKKKWRRPRRPHLKMNQTK